MSNQKVGVYLDIKNSKENRLGLPLPKGKIRVYKADASGSQQFVGEDWIDHTPRDERVMIKMGDAFDVVGERTQKEWRKIADHVEGVAHLDHHALVPGRVVDPVLADELLAAGGVGLVDADLALGQRQAEAGFLAVLVVA